MKKVIAILVGVLAFISLNKLNAQNNPIITGVETFGNWDTIAAGEVPQYWDAFNRDIIIMENNYGSVICVEKDSADPQDSDYSVRISNQSIMGSAVVPGLLTTAKLHIDFMNQNGDASGGVPYTQKPAQLKGWYKFAATAIDTAEIRVWFNNDSTQIGVGSIKISQKKTVWTMFTVNLDYQPTINPDTMNIMFASSILENNVPLGTVLEIDHIWFEGGSLAVNKMQNIVDDFKVFPNPSNGIVNIKAPIEAHEFDVNVYNSTGNRVKTFNNSSRLLSFNSNNLSKGVYFIEILHENRRSMQRLIVQ